MQRPTIGALSARVAIKRWSDVPNADDSGATSNYAPVATVWAKVEPVGGGIYLGSMQVGTTITHRITIRHRSDITADHVIEHGVRRYRVRRVTDLAGEGRFTVMECEEEGAV